MRDWTVGGAVIEAGALGRAAASGTGAGLRPDAVLLVENVRRDGRSDWTPPGGVIDGGEALVEGLTREVREETGLDVVSWVGPLYEITAEAPQLGWRLRVEVHLAVEVRGSLTVGADPDGIVVAADWVGPAACDARLDASPPWVREPLLEWMRERFDSTRSFRYTLHGEHPRELVVERG